MKEYNWHEERKKYQNSSSSGENTPQMSNPTPYVPAKPASSAGKFILLCVAIVIVLGTGVFFGVSKLLTLKNDAVSVTAPAPAPAPAPQPAPTPAPAPAPKPQPAPAPKPAQKPQPAPLEIAWMKSDFALKSLKEKPNLRNTLGFKRSNCYF